MKLSTIRLLHDIITTIISFLIVVSVFAAKTNTHHHLLVNAQEFFYNCGTLLVNAPYTETCRHNVATPLTYELPNGQTVSFGDESYLIAACMPFVERSIDTCICQVAVNPGAFILVPSDMCNSCNIQYISNTEFIASFDCSNRLVGDCVGFDAIEGECIDNNNNNNNTNDDGGVVPTPTPFPTTPTISPITTTQTTPTTPPITPYPNSATNPTPIPLLPVSVVATSNPSPAPFPAPVTTPTMNPAVTSLNPVTTTTAVPQGTNNNASDLVAGSPRSENEQSDKSSNSTVGVVIGCLIGGFVLAGLIGLFIFSHRRKPSESTSKPSDISTSNNLYDVDLDADDDIRSVDSPTERFDPIMPHLAALVQPTQLPSKQPPLYTITEAPSSYFSATEEFDVTGNSREASMADVDTLQRDENATSQLSKSSSSQQPSYPINHGGGPTITNEQFRNNVDNVPTTPAPEPQFDLESQFDRDIPLNIMLGVSTVTEISALSAPSVAMGSEPSGILFTDTDETL